MTVNDRGYGCFMYERMPQLCTHALHVTADPRVQVMCCVCGGGDFGSSREQRFWSTMPSMQVNYDEHAASEFGSLGVLSHPCVPSRWIWSTTRRVSHRTLSTTVWALLGSSP